jgi:hypothetical protein
MASAKTELRAVALSYALLGFLFVGLWATLFRFTWPGSWHPFWHALDFSIVAIFAAISGILFLLAALSMRYFALGRNWQFITFGASLLLALWSVAAALWQTLRPLEGPFVPMWSLICAKWLLAFALLGCSYFLWKHRASNNRLERPIAASVSQGVNR